MKTDLTWKDVYIVRAGRSITTWSGETIGLVVVGAREGQIPIWGNVYEKQATIYLCPEKKDLKQYADELNGVDCLSFITPAIYKLLNLIPRKEPNNNSGRD